MPNSNDNLTSLFKDLNNNQISALTDYEKNFLEKMAQPNRANPDMKSDLDILLNHVSKADVCKIFKIKARRAERLAALVELCKKPLVDKFGNRTLSYYFEIIDMAELLYRADGLYKLEHLEYVTTQARPLNKVVIVFLSEAGIEQDIILKILIARHGFDNLKQLTQLLIERAVNNEKSDLGRFEAAGFPQDEILSFFLEKHQGKTLLYTLKKLIFTLTPGQRQDLQEAGYGPLEILKILKGSNGVNKITTLVDLYHSRNFSINYLVSIGFNLSHIMSIISNNSGRENMSLLIRLLAAENPHGALTPPQSLNRAEFGIGIIHQALSCSGGSINLVMLLNFLNCNPMTDVDNKKIDHLIDKGFQISQIAHILCHSGGRENIEALFELTQYDLKQLWIPIIYNLANAPSSSHKITALGRFLRIKTIYNEFCEQPRALPAICKVLSYKNSKELSNLSITTLEELIEFFKAHYIKPRPNRMDNCISEQLEDFHSSKSSIECENDNQYIDAFALVNQVFGDHNSPTPQQEPIERLTGHKRHFIEYNSSERVHPSLFSKQLAPSAIYNQRFTINPHAAAELEPIASPGVSELISSTFPAKVSSIPSVMAGPYKSYNITASLTFFPRVHNLSARKITLRDDINSFKNT